MGSPLRILRITQYLLLGFASIACKPFNDGSAVKNFDAVLPQNSLEKIPPEEVAATAKIQQLISDRIKKDYPAGTRPAKRDAHAKHHGCVKADFKLNESLDPQFAVGAFQPGAVYKAWIRYSNGNGKDQDDAIGDGRGMAIKLTGVPGTKILESERNAQTQDFLMINHPSFFVRNAADYVDFSAKSADGNILSFFVSLNVFNWHLHELSIARAIQSKKVGNPLRTQYWTMTPYLLGRSAVKYSARSCFGGDDSPGKDPNYLRQAMRKTLSAGSACFEFMVQKQLDPVKMPVEDPTIEWDSAASPFVKIATITIPKQKFDSKDQMDFCENLSMTPWHSLPEQRPLGGINRVRKAVYEAISTLRHNLNGQARTEPTGEEQF